jgi:hypothetical protein
VKGAECRGCRLTAFRFEVVGSSLLVFSIQGAKTRVSALFGLVWGLEFGVRGLGIRD